MTHYMKILMDKRCTVAMADGRDYLARVTSVTDRVVDITLDDCDYVLRVYLGLALNRFKDSYPDIPEFYAC